MPCPAAIEAGSCADRVERVWKLTSFSIVDWILSAEICRNTAEICGSAGLVGEASCSTADVVSIVGDITPAMNAKIVHKLTRTRVRKRRGSEKIASPWRWSFKVLRIALSKVSGAVGQVFEIGDLTFGSRDTKYYQGA